MKKMTLTIKIMLDDFQYSQLVKDFENENAMRDYVKNYLDGNENSTVEIEDDKGNVIHRFELGVGSHNKMKLYDLV